MRGLSSILECNPTFRCTDCPHLDYTWFQDDADRLKEKEEAETEALAMKEETNEAKEAGEQAEERDEMDAPPDAAATSRPPEARDATQLVERTAEMEVPMAEALPPAASTSTPMEVEQQPDAPTSADAQAEASSSAPAPSLAPAVVATKPVLGKMGFGLGKKKAAPKVVASVVEEVRCFS